VETLGTFTYASAGLLFLLLVVLLAVSWKGRAIGLALIAACAASAGWALVLAYVAASGLELGALVLATEAARDVAWLIFLLALVRRHIGTWLWYAAHVVCAAVVIDILFGVRFVYPGGYAATISTALHFLLLSVLGLALVEQIYRNLRVARRPAVGFLCVGLGAMFAYDVALFSLGTLLGTINEELWYVRGIVNALAAPLVAVSARRVPDWSLDIFVSRKVVFYSTTFLASGGYFVAMGLVGYYLRTYGGAWGPALMAAFIVAAALIFVTAVYSTPLAAKWKVFLHKHFYRNKYEYRDEWLRVIRTLTHEQSGAPLRERAVRAMAEIVRATGGVLWRRTEEGDYAATANWNAEQPTDTVASDDAFLDFLATRRWIIDSRQLENDPDHYGGLVLPPQLVRESRRLIVPLLLDEGLYGFAELWKPAPTLELSYEDIDLLKTVGQQVSSYLAQEEAEEGLARHRQFEAYNQLAAFIMHDLKNVIAQQSLIVRNAAKHKRDPAFVDDMIRTIENSVARMQHLLGQLTHRPSLEARPVDLRQALDDVILQCRSRMPEPRVDADLTPVMVRTDREQLTAVLCHLVRNAQDATPRDGEVRIELKARSGRALIKVIDTGCGMDTEFVRERLFRPFDSTKGAKGMGIGAYQAREFVRKAGGRLTVQSVVGAGTTISIDLPVDATAIENPGARLRA
jgi:putative PEP-CTERM system histidine kinase